MKIIGYAVARISKKLGDDDFHLRQFYRRGGNSIQITTTCYQRENYPSGQRVSQNENLRCFMSENAIVFKKMKFYAFPELI